MPSGKDGADQSSGLTLDNIVPYIRLQKTIKESPIKMTAILALLSLDGLAFLWLFSTSPGTRSGLGAVFLTAMFLGFLSLLGHVGLAYQSALREWRESGFENFKEDQT